MYPLFTFFSIINLLGIAQAVFFFFVLIRLKNKDTKAHIFLALFLLAYALVQLSDVLEESRYFLLVPHLNYVFPPLVFILGPLFFFYVRSMTNKEFRFTRLHVLHFIPFLALLLILIPYFRLSSSEKLKLLHYEYLHPDPDLTIPYVGILQMLIYFLFSLQAILAYSRRLKDYYSSTEKLNLKWLLSFMLALIGIWMMWSLYTQFSSPFFKYAEATLFTLSIYVLGFKGIHQAAIFKQMNPFPVDLPNESTVELPSLSTAEWSVAIAEEASVIRKYAKSGIASDKVAQALSALKDKMERDKVYKNSQLTILELATLISIPSHHLSQLLSEHLQLNFYDFVNRYRIEEVKGELGNPKKRNLTILALALEAGFNSKASFNKAFKKHTGLSPSEYKALQAEKPLPNE